MRQCSNLNIASLFEDLGWDYFYTPGVKVTVTKNRKNSPNVILPVFRFSLSCTLLRIRLLILQKAK
jgi:hypothetical protein